MQVIKYTFQSHGDDRGQLVALEEFKDIPFRIKRVYYMYDTAKGVRRGGHAHKNLQRKQYHWKNHTKGFMLQIICGEKCLTFHQMQYCWC